MKTYKKDYFLPYPIETVREVLRHPVRLPFVPLTEESEVLIKNDNDWLVKRANPSPVRPNIEIHCEAEFNEETDHFTLKMHSKLKKLTDICTVQLMYVGDYRTKFSLRYDIAYCWYKLSHLRQRIAVFYNNHALYVNTFASVRDAADAECAKIDSEEK